MEWQAFVRTSQEYQHLSRRPEGKYHRSWTIGMWVSQSEMEGTECTRSCAKKGKKMSEAFLWTITRKWSGDKRTWKLCKMKHKRKPIWRLNWNYCGRLLKWGSFPCLPAQKEEIICREVLRRTVSGFILHKQRKLKMLGRVFRDN